ncbi:YadA family autotransporter adhesin [Variovorax sp. PAMC 28711]|uniref:YadA family autotransporter adhesin n=1 Tax=Variovorax sp. PAMC 28711 TaxID=1795631 RepID=UPI00078CB5CD|nr:YadA-like family protein [Variovorax sp. PAMC 28711]AMM23736.1 hypothetical protein AX767_04800 [Variovorax sp. PAMC 28711]
MSLVFQVGSRLTTGRSKFGSLPILSVAMLAAGLLGSGSASAAGFLNPCTGISLPRSSIFNYLNPVLGPIVGSPLLSILGLGTIYSGLATGQPLSLSLLDNDGALLSPSDDCKLSTDGYSLNVDQGVSIGGNGITGLGTKGGAAALAGAKNAIAIGDGATTGALAPNALALGSGATVANVAVAAGAVALGAGSQATGVLAAPYVPVGGTYAVAGNGVNANRELSIGSAGNERRITHVAAGGADTDAVNVSQLKSVVSAVGVTAANAVQYDGAGKTVVTLQGATSTDGGATNGTRIGNVAQGALSATSADAVNGAQLFATNQNVGTNTTNLNALTTNINNGTVGLVQQAGGSPGAGVIAVGASTAGTSVSIAGTGGNRVLGGVAAGTVATDAVNLGQLNAVGATAANAVQYDGAGKAIVTLQGTTSTDGGLTNGTRIANLSQGMLAATSTDAVNGAQLFATNQNVGTNTTNLNALTTNINNGSVGLVQQAGGAPGAGIIAVGASTGGTSVSLTGTAGDRVLGGVAPGVLANDAVNVGQLTALGAGIANAVSYDSAARTQITLGGPLSTDGGVTGGTRMANLSRGIVSATSSQAVNGAQLFATNQNIASVVNVFGGNAMINFDGTVVGPTYTLSTITAGGGTTVGNYSTVGDALSALGSSVINLSQTVSSNAPAGNGSKYVQVTSALGGATATGNDSTAIGPQALAAGASSIAIGTTAQATSTGAVALGAGAVASRAGMAGQIEALSGVAVASTQGALSIGAPGAERQITNVAGGTQATDAVNLRQLQAVQAGGVNYATGADGVVNYNQITLGNGQAPGGTVISNVAPGVSPADAVNVQQLNSSVQAARQYTDLRTNQLVQGMQNVARKAYAGVAAAMAMESPPVVPGKLSYSAGMGYYESESAVGIALRRTTVSGRWSLSGGVSATGAGSVAARVGVSGFFE